METKEEKKYKIDVLFLHRSKAGKHLYIFGVDGKSGKPILGGDGKPILGEGVKSLLMNVVDVQAVLGGGSWAKVSVMREEEENSAEG